MSSGGMYLYQWCVTLDFFGSLKTSENENVEKPV